MDKIQNRIHIEVENTLRGYEKKDLFDVIRIANTTNQNIVKYGSTFQCVNFIMSIEYINGKIEFGFSCDSINSSETFSEIHGLKSCFESINKENLLLILKQYE